MKKSALPSRLARFSVLAVTSAFAFTTPVSRLSRDVKLTIGPDRGDDVWNAVYADAHFYEWLLQQHLGQ